MNNVNNDLKNNNRNRFVYSFLFIFLLVLISIMYASLAINVGVKINTPKVLEPKDSPIVKPVEEKKEEVNPKTSTPSIPITKKVTPVVPVIIPNNINWKIEFDNLNVDSASVRAITEAHILSSKTEINYEVLMTEPGEFYTFDVDIVNKGNIDAKIYDIVESGINEEQRRFLDYKVTYKDGTPISKNNTLNKGNKKTITVFLKFKEDVNPDDLPDGGQDLKLSYKLIYVQR